MAKSLWTPSHVRQLKSTICPWMHRTSPSQMLLHAEWRQTEVMVFVCSFHEARIWFRCESLRHHIRSVSRIVSFLCVDSSGSAARYSPHGLTNQSADHPLQTFWRTRNHEHVSFFLATRYSRCSGFMFKCRCLFLNHWVDSYVSASHHKLLLVLFYWLPWIAPFLICTVCFWFVKHVVNLFLCFIWSFTL